MKSKLQQKTTSRRLLLLLGISLLLHGLLLHYWPISKPVLEFDSQLQNLALNLEPIEVVEQQTQAQETNIADSNMKSTPESRPLPDKPAITERTTSLEQTAHQASDNSETLQALPPASKARGIAPAMNRARILRQIRHDLTQYFYYPPLARRKGLQGTVLLGFGISGQGAIHDIRVVKSSGYAILDLAAQDAMQRLEKLSWYAATLHGKDMDLELPVIFRLTEG